MSLLVIAIIINSKLSSGSYQIFIQKIGKSSLGLIRFRENWESDLPLERKSDSCSDSIR